MEMHVAHVLGDADEEVHAKHGLGHIYVEVHGLGHADDSSEMRKCMWRMVQAAAAAKHVEPYPRCHTVNGLLPVAECCVYKSQVWKLLNFRKVPNAITCTAVTKNDTQECRQRLCCVQSIAGCDARAKSPPQQTSRRDAVKCWVVL